MMLRNKKSRSIPILLILPMFATIVAISFHHHIDFQDNSDAVLCKICKDLSASDVPQVMQLPLLEIVISQACHEVIHCIQSCFVIRQNSRAPPNLTSL
jgi:hypothetical protein